jgi:hypothetical protein
VCFIKNKKKPFILIESLLAIGIIGLTLSYLLQSPAKLFKKNIELLCDMELSRESQRLFFSLERLFKEKHSFLSLSKEPKKFFLNDLNIELTSSFQRNYQCWYEVSITKDSLTEDKTHCLLLKISLNFQSDFDKKPHKYIYYLTAMHSPKSKTL